MFTLGMKVEFSDSDEVATVVEIWDHDGRQYLLLRFDGGVAWYLADDERLLAALDQRRRSVLAGSFRKQYGKYPAV